VPLIAEGSEPGKCARASMSPPRTGRRPASPTQRPPALRFACIGCRPSGSKSDPRTATAGWAADTAPRRPRNTGVPLTKGSAISDTCCSPHTCDARIGIITTARSPRQLRHDRSVAPVDHDGGACDVTPAGRCQKQDHGGHFRPVDLVDVEESVALSRSVGPLGPVILPKGSLKGVSIHLA